MISVRMSRGSARSAAVFVRFVAFLVAAASAFVIPLSFAGAATGHETAQAAFATSGAAVGLSLATSLLARSFDPMRG